MELRTVPVLEPVDADAVESTRAELPENRTWRTIIETFEALADPTRALMLFALTRRHLCVRDLASLADVSQSAASHQLRFLRERHLVRLRRGGNRVYYAVDNQQVMALFREAEYHADHVGQIVGAPTGRSR